MRNDRMTFIVGLVTAVCKQTFDTLIDTRADFTYVRTQNTFTIRGCSSIRFDKDFATDPQIRITYWVHDPEPVKVKNTKTIFIHKENIEHFSVTCVTE